jgi:hypothetical protein
VGLLELPPHAVITTVSAIAIAIVAVFVVIAIVICAPAFRCLRTR